jgi:hypothetical protein
MLVCQISPTRGNYLMPQPPEGEQDGAEDADDMPEKPPFILMAPADTFFLTFFS